MHGIEPSSTQRTRAHQLERRVRELERELTEQKALQAASAAYLAQLEAVIDGAPLSIFLKDAAHRFILVNREFEQVTACTRANTLGRTDFEVFSGPVAQLFREQDLEVLARGARTEFRETVELPAGLRSFITSKFPLRAPDGTLTAVAGVCTEVTALEQAQQRLVESREEFARQERLAALGELTALVAHEVRNPLGVIFNALSVLGRTLPAEQEGASLVGVIADEAERLNRLVRETLELVQPVAPSLAPGPLVEVVRGAIDAARQTAACAEAVRLLVPEAVPDARFDAQQVHRAVVNLVSNALEARGRRGPVTVTVRLDAPGARVLRVEVSDDGGGIAEALKARIFEPFVTTRAKGIGLGLTVVRRVADAHGGSISVEDTPGGGATFVLRLPVGPLAVDSGVSGAGVGQ